ncbi:hypothetical protein E2C01_082425 [Portunus trituberculatus]|uniref:Uncharacterized protein n=1 Tax=Portunus trituberculatus TaxID=210409 RepID=A0A5B7IZ33_PORTR|nr:hypothetical protein [Portunus trituberculatus]
MWSIFEKSRRKDRASPRIPLPAAAAAQHNTRSHSVANVLPYTVLSTDRGMCGAQILLQTDTHQPLHSPRPLSVLFPSRRLASPCTVL